MSALKSVVVDVNNVLWTFSRPSAGVRPSFDRLWPVVDALRSAGISTIIGVADANVRELVEGGEPADGLFDSYEVVAPGTRADTRILELAQGVPALVISNDKFRAEKRRDRWAKRNVHRVVVSVHYDATAIPAVRFGANCEVLFAAGTPEHVDGGAGPAR